MTSYLGHGIGLRSQYYDYILQHRPAVDWFEVLTENYLVAGGRPLYYLDQIVERYPVVMHGVSLSIGSCDPLNFDYLAKVKQLAQRIQPHWVSDHLCWTGINGINIHDLLPLPYTEEALNHVAERVQRVQDFLHRPLVLENVSSYITYADSQMSEWEFLAALVAKTDCRILLDINNVYVSAYNHGFNPEDFLKGIPVASVQQFHLAGHENCGKHIIDTHDHAIIKAVWQLYEIALRRFGRVATLIERDDRFPAFQVLLKEMQQAKAIAEKIFVEQGNYVSVA